MAGVERRNNKKRLECLKKKSEELSVLCDVEVMFLCREDGDASSSSSSSSAAFHSWPEDPNACLSSIDKYRKSSKYANLHSLRGKRKERVDDDQANFGKKVRVSEGFQMGFPNTATESSSECERESECESSRSEMMGCLRNFVQKFESVVDVVGYEDLEKVKCLVDEAKKRADEQIQFLIAGGRGGEEEQGVPNILVFEDSVVDWEGFMNNIQTADFDFDFDFSADYDFNFDFEF